jgi:hypothetical protein
VRLSATVGLILVTGCTLAAIPNGLVLCSGGSCPSGFLCQADGRCWQTGTGPDAGRDAGVDAGCDAGFDAGADGGLVDAGGCVIGGDGAFPDLLYPRWGLGGAFVLYSNGASNYERIFAAGGFDPAGDTAADVQGDEFDMGSNWVQVGTVGSSNFAPRALFPLVTTPLGVVALGGITGSGAVLGDLVLLPGDTPSVFSATWEETGAQMIQPRFDHAAVLANGEMIACGGIAGGAPTSSCETYSLTYAFDGGWQSGPSMSKGRQGLSMAVGSDENIYAFGGSGFDPSSLTSFEMLNPNDLDAGWSCPGACPTMLSGHFNGAAAVVGSKMYVMGGLASPIALSSISTVEFLDLANLSAGWQEAANMSTARSSFGAVVLPTGAIRVFGGQGGPLNSCTIASVEEYTPSTNQWQ